MAKKSVPRKARRASGHRSTEEREKAGSKTPPAKHGADGSSQKNSTPPDADLFPIVGLGASAGGLDAFTLFLKALPTDTGMAFVLIQHMDPTHDSVLGSLLQRSTKLPIREVTDQMVVEPNHIYICPPNSLMAISQGVLSLVTRGLRSYKDYPIDRFFVSLAEDRKSLAIGVVLSGTASDGTRGLQAIKEQGGITFAQDSESARFSSMPASAIASGCVDLTLPPQKIAAELARINGHSYIHWPVRQETAEPAATGDGVQHILRQLRLATGVDLELYKPAMIGRRVARRMALQRIDSHQRYLSLIRKDRRELMALYEDIFIHVTEFFRDPESLQALQQRVLSRLTSSRSERVIRIWVPGCSSGEEVYSIAILLCELLGERRSEMTIQIFGTDISEVSVQRARTGIYPNASMVDVSQDRQRRFFNRLDGSFQVIKAIRDMCVFARHDLSKDPPFSRIDLISCRNVLIYMGSALQKKVVEGFHYSLKPGGYLLLGKSESLSAYSSLFSVTDPKHKILSRRSLESPPQVHVRRLDKAADEQEHDMARQARQGYDIGREAERVLLNKYAPAAVVVDSNLQVLHFQGNTGPFLAPASGEPSFHLLRIIRPELLVDVRTALYSARKQLTPIHKEGIRVKQNGASALVDVDVLPLKPRRGADETDFLVVLRETPVARKQPSESSVEPAMRDRVKARLEAKEREIGALREQLQDLIRDHEAADEEVRSMNEEILSSNEELQNTNEELETAKEELESTNEELTTLNDELQKRNTDLSQVSDDLSNVVVAVDIPVIILDSALRIRRFTPAASRVLNLIATDVGRPLSDIASTLKSLNWKDLINEAIASGEPLLREVQDQQGRWYALRMHPYQSAPERLGGMLISLFDIDAMKRSIEEAGEARLHTQDLEARLLLAGEGLKIGIWDLDLATGEIQGTRQWSLLYGFLPGKTVSRGEWLERIHPGDRKVLRDNLDHILESGEISSLEHRVILPDGSTHWLNGRAELVHDAQKKPARIRGVSIDISVKRSPRENQAFALRVAAAQEAERRRIARELHDGLIQDLAGMALDLGQRVTEQPASPAELKRDYKELQNRVVRAAEVARHVAYELHPSEIDDLGLEKALEAYCEQFGQENRIQVDFQSRKIPKNLKRETASGLYKVAQEGLRNIVKHAHVKRAKVVLDSADGFVRLRVEDKGDGFAISSLQGSSGLGVASMRERVQLINGKFTIHSAPGNGTQIVAEAPII